MTLNLNNQPESELWRHIFNVFAKNFVFAGDYVTHCGNGQIESTRRAFLQLDHFRFFDLDQAGYLSIEDQELTELFQNTFIELGERPSWLMPGYTCGYLWDKDRHYFRRALRHGTTINFE